MRKKDLSAQDAVIAYYSRPTTRLGYNLVMRGSKHFGYYDTTHTTERAAQGRFLEKVLELLDAKPGMRVLDAGCGQGILAAYVAEHTEAHVTGITLVPFEVKDAAHLAARRGVAGRTSFVIGDYTKAPFRAASFERIYAVETLSHVPDVQKALESFHRLLKPGGKLVCVEYEAAYGLINEKDAREGKFIAKYGALHGADQFGKGRFPKRLKWAGFTDATEEDWTPHVLPSFRRLRRLAKPFQPLVRIFGLRPFLINAIAAGKYADWTEAGKFKFKAYTATKPAAKKTTR